MQYFLTCFSMEIGKRDESARHSLQKKIFLMFILEIERETEHEQGRGREREGDRESKAGSRL